MLFVSGDRRLDNKGNEVFHANPDCMVATLAETRNRRVNNKGETVSLRDLDSVATTAWDILDQKVYHQSGAVSRVYENRVDFIPSYQLSRIPSPVNKPHDY